MKLSRLTFAAAAGLLLATASCKPNESAYKAAYESAVARRDSTGGLEGTVYNKYREMGKETRIPLGNDTLRVFTEFVGMTENGGATRESLERYNVVVGRFKQVFNAREMRQRLLANGYDGAFILHTREPLYYVVAETCGSAQCALEGLQRVMADSTMTLRSPLPFVLQPAHMAR